MAFVPKDPNLEDEDQEPGAGGGQQIGAESSAISGGAGGGAPGSGKATPQNRTASSSGFTNLNKYIDANKPQAAELGGKIKDQVTSSVNAAGQAADDSDKGYSEKVNPGQFSFDAKTFNPMTQNRAQFQNLFKAPTQKFGMAGEMDGARNLADTARAKVGQTETIGGRKELIGDQQTLSKAAGVNTAGMRSFDNLLLQSSDEGKAALGGARQSLADADLDAKLQAAATRGANVDTQAATNQQAASQAARGALTSQAASLNEGIGSRLQGEQARVNARESQLLGAAGTGANLTSEDLKDLGVTPEQWAEAQGLFTNKNNAGFLGDKERGLSKFIKRSGSSGDLTREDVTTDDDIARSNALAELGGLSRTKLDLGGVPKTSRAGGRDYLDLDIDGLLKSLRSTDVKVPDVFQRGGMAGAGPMAGQPPSASTYQLEKAAEQMKGTKPMSQEEMFAKLGL